MPLFCFFSIYVFKLCASSSFALEEVSICEQIMDPLSNCYVSVRPMLFFISFPILTTSCILDHLMSTGQSAPYFFFHVFLQLQLGIPGDILLTVSSWLESTRCSCIQYCFCSCPLCCHHHTVACCSSWNLRVL